MKGDLVSITEAAQRLEVVRSTLTKLLDEAGITKLKQGRETLVSFIDAKRVVTEAVAASRIRMKNGVSGSSTTAKSARGGSQPDEMTLFLMDQVRTLQRERDEFADKIRALEKIQGDNKILQLAASEKDRKIAALEEELDLLKGKNRRKGAVSESADLKKRASKALNVLLGKA